MTKSPNSNSPKIPWNDWYHCMGHTYGTWLPGSPKGFRTRRHRQHIEGDYKFPPPAGKYDGLHQFAKNAMNREAVFIATGHRAEVLKFLIESLQRREIEVIVASVDSMHLHVLARFPDRDPRRWIGIAKKESSHFAKKMNCAAPGGLWAVRTTDEPIRNRAHQVSTFRYILRHSAAGAAVWTIPKKRN